jgi:PAS domain S-box-containing protein
MSAEWQFIVNVSVVALSLGVGMIGFLLLLSRSREKAKQARETVKREGDRKYATLFHTVSDCIYVHTPDGMLLDVNQSTADLLGLPISSVVGTPLSRWIAPRYHTALVTYLDRMKGSHGVERGVLPLMIQSPPHILILEYRSTPIVENGTVVRVQGIARDITEQKRYERSLRRSETKMKTLLERATVMRRNLEVVSREMMRVQEEERVRISRELHDEVSQVLARIRMNLTLMKDGAEGRGDPDLNTKVVDTEKLAGELLNRIRQFLKELRPTGLDEFGLAAAIRRFATQCFDNTGCYAAVSGDVDSLDLFEGEKRTIIFRVIQEGLTNIMKHAHATSVEVRIVKRANDLVIRIHDNGVGFDTKLLEVGSNHNRGIGLLGMSERAQLIRGEFRIQSTVGAGTTIVVTIPSDGTQSTHDN